MTIRESELIKPSEKWLKEIVLLTMPCLYQQLPWTFLWKHVGTACFQSVCRVAFLIDEEKSPHLVQQARVILGQETRLSTKLWTGVMDNLNKNRLPFWLY